MDYTSPFMPCFLLLPGIIVILLFLEQFFGPGHHPGEPPLVSQRIPFIGHLLGFFLYGTPYFNAARYLLTA